MPDFDPDRLQTERPAGPVSMTVRPRKLDRDAAEKLVRKYNPDITQAAVKGEVDNIVRESGGNAANDTGDGGTSGGLYQHHNQRLTGLKSFAEKNGKDWQDPEIQVQYSRLEKERDYPALLKLQQTSDDRSRNEDAFKRIFERPASVLWGNDANGQPVLGNDRYRFSDYAMREHNGRRDTDLLMMSPGEYLDLSPELNGKPFESPSGRALMKSFNKGDAIESVPTLDVKVDGPTATVTDQDGRHRALLAQQEGIEAIPVAVRGIGNAQPKEIVGTNGVPMAHDFPKASAVQGRQESSQPAKPTISLFQSAEAAEPGRDAAGNAVDAAVGPRPAWADAGAASAPEGPRPAWMGLAEPQLATPDASIMAGLRGVAKGVGDTVFGGQELIGKGMQTVGIPGGEALTEDARARMAAEKQNIAANEAAHPVATGAGEFLGGLVAPGGIAGKMVAPANALRAGALSGALSGLLSPGDPNHYWSEKAVGAGVGAAAGAVTGKAGNALASMVAPSFRQTVATLMKEGVQLTPGQMAGGAMKRAEDALGSVPLLGSAIRAAQRRSVETFNRAAINRSLADIGATLPPGTDAGHSAIGFAETAFHDAYDAVIPRMIGRLDHGFQKDLNDLVIKAQTENLPPAYQDQLQHVITRDILEPFRAGSGDIDGKSAQKIGTRLDELINPLKRGGVYEQQMAQYLREADAALDNLMQRQNPALQAAKDRIDAGYAKFKTVQNASTALGAKDGVFTPAQLSRAVRARDRSKDKAAFARGDAMMQDLSTAARDVLPQVVPDSGTPERAALMGLIGGAAHIEPHTGAVLGGLAVPYTAPASKAMNAAVNRLAQTPGPTRSALAEIFRRGGQVAAPAAGSAGATEMQSRMSVP